LTVSKKQQPFKRETKRETISLRGYRPGYLGQYDIQKGRYLILAVFSDKNKPKNKFCQKTLPWLGQLTIDNKRVFSASEIRNYCKNI